MPRIDLDSIAPVNSTGYPNAHAGMVRERWVRRLGPVSGLSDFGVSHVVLKPGAASSHRHWHEDEDEFIVVLAGEAVLVEDDARTLLHPGDMAAFPKGEPNGHHLVNESGADCVLLAFGRPPSGDCHYSDVDMLWSGGAYRHRDGSSY
ncbi:MAG TPA: cupin domain-containing protein [Sphingobium sp.]|uniref:cupin domain-containing protein n=1 Tax=unclassified Sphingobium TaxID=2611147 RepID=UPI0007F4954D|nr:MULTISPECIES: cupin domain-containing protein [unclassified Sphingobium]OAN51177.1 transcriptional regulator [Sphingobium sp. TCM1]WIW87692.1 cupin domain-containing protein [Sphingobium sp. V4]HAF43043.1 cupin domain-containing protein [Sphingobium sp.]